MSRWPSYVRPHFHCLAYLATWVVFTSSWLYSWVGWLFSSGAFVTSLALWKLASWKKTCRSDPGWLSNVLQQTVVFSARKFHDLVVVSLWRQSAIGRWDSPFPPWPTAQAFLYVVFFLRGALEVQVATSCQSNICSNVFNIVFKLLKCALDFHVLESDESANLINWVWSPDPMVEIKLPTDLYSHLNTIIQKHTKINSRVLFQPGCGDIYSNPSTRETEARVS